MQLANPYQQYKEQSLATLTPGEILVKLYEELTKQLMLAKIKIEAKDFGAVNNALTKSQTIVNTLASSLDMRYPISKELRDMYVFISQHLLQANLKKDAKMVEECIPLVKDLRDAFEQADRISRKQTQQRVGVGNTAV